MAACLQYNRHKVFLRSCLSEHGICHTLDSYADIAIRSEQSLSVLPLLMILFLVRSLFFRSVCRWVLLIPTEKKILNLLVWFHLPHLRLGIIQASLASALAARSVRFVIFPFLSGAYCQFSWSRCPHRSLKNWHSALRDKSKIWQSELIEPTCIGSYDMTCSVRWSFNK